MNLVLHVQTERWMQSFTPVNDERPYYLIGKITNLNHTDCVVLTEGIAQRKLLCAIHNFVYEFGDACQPCQLQVMDETKRAGVTTRNTT